MASIGTLLFTLAFGKKAGEDEFGNKYYESAAFAKNVGRYNKNRRWVIYNGKAEPSKIPPQWHGWMHYSIDELPAKEVVKEYKWQKTHLPNLTGTEYAYLPPGDKSKKGVRDKATGDYTPWQPQ